MPAVVGYSFDVRAPSADLVIEFTAPRLSFLVTSMGRPVPIASVTIRPVAGDPPLQDWICTTERDGSAVILVPSDRTWDVEIGAVGLVTRRLTLQGPGVGEVLHQDVELAPGAAAGRLEIQTAKSVDHPFGTISAGFFETDSTAQRPVFTRNGVGRSNSGAFEIADLPPGCYRVDLRVSKNWGRYFETSYLPAEFEVEIRSGETTQIEKTFELGGRVRVRVRNSAGDSLPARVTLMDAEGSAVSVEFVQFDPSANSTWVGTWQPHMIRAHPERFVDVQPAFATGSYSVEVEQDGFQRRSEVFLVEAGKIVDLDFTLDPARR